MQMNRYGRNQLLSKFGLNKEKEKIKAKIKIYIASEKPCSPRGTQSVLSPPHCMAAREEFCIGVLVLPRSCDWLCHALHLYLGHGGRKSFPVLLRILGASDTRLCQGLV